MFTVAPTAKPNQTEPDWAERASWESLRRGSSRAKTCKNSTNGWGFQTVVRIGGEEKHNFEYLSPPPPLSVGPSAFPNISAELLRRCRWPRCKNCGRSRVVAFVQSEHLKWQKMRGRICPPLTHPQHRGLFNHSLIINAQSTPSARRSFPLTSPLVPVSICPVLTMGVALIKRQKHNQTGSATF